VSYDSAGSALLLYDTLVGVALVELASDDGGLQAVAVARRSTTGDWSDAANSPLCLPILGLKLAELRGEPWLEHYSQSREVMQEWGVSSPPPPFPALFV